MTAPRTPRNLTPIELLLRHYATQPDTTLPNPLDILDRSTVHHTAAHGPRTPDDAEHIHATPHLLQLLSELWNDEPPTPETITTCLATSEGANLLTATGHTPPTNSDTKDASRDRLDTINDDTINTLIFEFETYLLITAKSSFRETLSFRGMREPESETPSTPDAASAYPAANNPDHQLTVKQTTSGVGQPQLSITHKRPTLLIATGQRTWTLTATFTNPDGTTTTISDTQTIPDTDTSPTWSIPASPNQSLTALTLSPSLDADSVLGEGETVAQAMSTFDIEWWLLSAPELAAAASSEGLGKSVVDVHPSGSLTVTRMEESAERAWVEVELRAAPGQLTGQVIRARVGGLEGIPYLFILIEEGSGHYVSALDVPAPGRWVVLAVDERPRTMDQVSPADLEAITRSVKAATLVYKSAWQDLARSERDREGGDPRIVQAIIDGLTQ